MFFESWLIPQTDSERFNLYDSHQKRDKFAFICACFALPRISLLFGLGTSENWSLYWEYVPPSVPIYHKSSHSDLTLDPARSHCHDDSAQWDILGSHSSTRTGSSNMSTNGRAYKPINIPANSTYYNLL